MADVILNLVNMPIFKKLMIMPLQDLFNEIEVQTLRDKRPELDNTVESFNANDDTQETINLKTNTYNKMRISPHKKHS